MDKFIENEINNHINLAKELVLIQDEINNAANHCIEALRKGKKILLFGNGGSAADAQHIAAELTGRFRKDRIGLAAIAITTDTSAITSIGNDYGFENIYSRQIEAIASRGDIIIGISTSGSSINVLEGVSYAKNMGLYTIGLLGNTGGEISKVCDTNIIIKNSDTARIQEMHILVGHIICAIIDENIN